MAIEDNAFTFIATLFGILIGIPVALWIDRKTRISSQREKAIAVLSALKEEINHNVALLRQIQTELKPNSVIYYNMDMNTWRAASLEEFEDVIFNEVLRKIFRIYYEYEHMSRKIDTQFNMHYSIVRSMDTYLQERKQIVGAILVHATTLEKESEQLINEIENELTRLSRNQRKTTQHTEQAVTPNRQADEQGTEKVDHFFEVGLVLITVLSASLLQYLSSKYSFDTTLTNAEKLRDLSFAFKELTLPIVILILVWLLKELIPSGRFLSSLKRFVKEFCWTFFSIFLVLQLLSFILFGFITEPNQPSSIVLIMTFFASLFTFPLTWQYRGYHYRGERLGRREIVTPALFAVVEHFFIFFVSYLVLLEVILLSVLPAP